MRDDPGARSDASLIAASLAGDESAFRELVRRHEAPVYRLVRGQIGDADESYDVAQETFVAAFRALRRFDTARSLRVWLSRIALNKTRDWARRRAVRRFLSKSTALDTAEALSVADSAQPADRIVDDRNRLDQVWQALARLPRRYREPLVLCAVEGLSQAEAAEALGVSPKSVETRVRRARELLRLDLAGSPTDPDRMER